MAAETERKAPLIVALSSRTLFDLDESNRVFEEEGVGVPPISDCERGRAPRTGRSLPARAKALPAERLPGRIE